MSDLRPAQFCNPSSSPASGQRRSDPLSDILLRPTTLSPYAAPVSPRGLTAKVRREDRAVEPASVRSRLLEAAARSVAEGGVGISLAQVAQSCAVSPAAASAEFPDAEQLLAALLLSEVEQAISDLAHRELGEALHRAAEWISDHRLLAHVGDDDAAVLLRMARIDVTAPGWQAVGLAVEAALSRAGRRGTPTVLRWLASYLSAPADPADIPADVDVLLAGLPPLPARAGWTQRRTG